MSRPYCILVAEDDQTVRELIIDVMHALDFDAQGAANAGEALNLLNQQAFDLLITDLGLPDMSGIELARKSLEKNAQLKVLIASGYIQNHDLIHQSMHEPLDERFHLIGKPFTLEQIRLAVEQILTNA